MVAGVPGTPFSKDTSGASPIDISGGEPEPTDFSSSSAKCAQCHKYYASFDTLKEHIQLCHPDRSIGFSCLHCNAVFSNRHQLDKHEQLHSPHVQVVSQISMLCYFFSRVSFILSSIVAEAKPGIDMGLGL